VDQQNDPAPQQQPVEQQPPGTTAGQVIGMILAAIAVLFIISAWNNYQEAEDHQDKANCHFERADAILNGDPNPPACP